MQIIKIPKKKLNEFRTIYIADKKEKRRFKKAVKFLNKMQNKNCNPLVVHGFCQGKNVATNALLHIGYQYTTCFDIKDFFDSVTPDKIKLWKLKKGIKNKIDKLFVDGAARQGLPSSPLLANLACLNLDKSILKEISIWPKTIYTRYADDLSFSYNDSSVLPILLEFIPKTLAAEGFQINSSKTRTMSAKNGRRIITGVAVDKDNIYPTRRTKRKLRSALHHGTKSKILGLSEFCKLNFPKDMPAALTHVWKDYFFNLIRKNGTKVSNSIFTIKHL